MAATHLPHGVGSPPFTQAWETTSTKRHLDVSGARDRDFGSTTSSVTFAKFVQPPFLPSGFSTDVKLHSNTCVAGGLEYSVGDAGRWGSRLSIGQSRFGEIAKPMSTRVAEYVPTGYTRKNDAIFSGGGSPYAAPSMPTAPYFGSTMTAILPSGYSLNRKPAGLAENLAENDLGASRFLPDEPARSTSMAGGDVSPTRFSAYTRSLVSTARAPIGAAPDLALHPTQARLRSLNAPFEQYDVHAHKARF